MGITLNRKISIGISIIVIITMAAVMTMGKVSVTRAIEQKIREDMLAAYKVFEYFQQDRLRELLDDNQMAAKIPYLRAVAATPGIDHATVLDSLKEVQTITHGDLLMITDADGKLLASVSQPERSGDDLSKEPAFQKALAREHFTGVWTLPQGVYQVAASPFLFAKEGEGEDGEVAGVLLSGYAVDRGVIDRLARMSNCEIALITPYQAIISSSANPLLGNLGETYRPSAAATPQIIKKSFGEEKYLLLNVPLADKKEDGNYILARSLDKELVFFRRLQFGLLLMGCFILVAALLLGVAYSRRITRPIQMLWEGVHRLTAGDMASRVTISTGGDEINRLAKEFNTMAENLHHTTVSKNFVDSIITNMNNSLIVLTPVMEIQMVNEATCALLGYQEKELLGQYFDMLLTGDGTSIRSRVEGLRGKEVVRNEEIRYKAKDGRDIYVLFSAACLSAGQAGLMDKNNKVKGLVCVAQDITERKEAEVQRIRLAAALHAVGDAVIITDTDGVIEYVNPAFERISRYGAAEAVGRKPSILKSGVQNSDFYKTLWETILSDKMWTATLVNRKKDGTLFACEQSVTPIKDASGRIVNFVGILHDITKRQEMENKLSETNKDLVDREKTLRMMLKDLTETHENLKQAQHRLLQAEKLASIGQLAAGVAHELNNPVGFINNNMEILEQYIAGYTKILRLVGQIKESVDQGDLTKAKAIAEKITSLEKEINLDYVINDMPKLLEHNLKGIERIRKIVMDLRTFAREDKNEMEHVKIEEVIEGILTIVHSEIKYKAKLERDYGDTPPIECNPQKLGQVFINLIVNALQAIEGSGTITIKTCRQDEFVRVDVRDTGRGIPPENLNKIFDPFFTTKPVGQGTGLGLSVSFEIVKKHNGSMTVQSKVGEGTTFTIALPINQEKGRKL